MSRPGGTGSAWSGAVGLVLCALAAPAVAQSVPQPLPEPSSPALTHSAPRMAGTLELTVSGARAGAEVRIYASPAAGSFHTRYGKVELDPAGFHRVDTTTADGLGTASFAFPAPTERADAETEVHYQALASDPDARHGAVWSNAAHLRWTGSRLYAAVLDVGEEPSVRRLLVRSAVVDQDLFTVDATGDRPPAFSPDAALGAIAGGGEIVVFDNFFGDVRHRIAAPLVSERLFADGHGFWALRDDSIERIAFVTGETTASAPLPESATLWAMNGARTEAYVGTRVADIAAVRQLDLTTGTDLGTTILGPEPRVLAIAWAKDRVVVLTGGILGFDCLSDCERDLHRIDYGPPVPVVHSTAVSDYTDAVTFLPVPAADVVITWQSDNLGVPFWAFEMLSTPLSGPGPATPVAEPPSFHPAFARRIVRGTLEGRFAWFTEPTCCGGEEGPGGIYRLDTAAGTWKGPTNAFYDGEVSGTNVLARVGDRYGRRLFAPLAHANPFLPQFLRVIPQADHGEKDQPYTLVDPAHVRAIHAEVVPAERRHHHAGPTAGAF